MASPAAPTKLRPCVPPTPWVTSQEADITRRVPKAACWLKLGCWSNISAISHPNLGALNHRVLRACLVPQCSYPPHRPRHQQHLANCDWMPVSYTSGQTSNPRRHPTCWASSQWSHNVSSTPFHGAWTSAPLSAHPSIECERTATQNRHTHLYLPHNISSVYLTTTTYVRRRGRNANGMRSGRIAPQDSAFSSSIPAPTHPGWTFPRRAWVRLNRLRTGVGRFRSCLYKWGMASSATCECGAEGQTVDHVVLQCPIHRPPHGLHGLTVLDDETVWMDAQQLPEI